MRFLDTETVGRHGMIVLIQHAIDDGEIELFSPWTCPVSETLELISQFVEEDVCGFNLAFDWFHLCKLYTTFTLLAQKHGMDVYPVDHIDEVAILEKEARDGPCLKPKGCLDLMLHARKGPYQSYMNRDDIRIRRVPTQMAWELAAELEKRIPMKDGYFARSGEGRGVERWKVYDVKTDTGENNVDFKDVVCKFAPSTALKALAQDALGVDNEDILFFDDIECKIYPEEQGWAPFALATGSPGKWNGAWPEVIRHHIQHWAYNEIARRYAKNDVVYTRGLHHYFAKDTNFPLKVNDDDSVLACMVATVRWRGYKVNIEGIKELRLEAIKRAAETVTAPAQVKHWLTEVMNAEELPVLNEGTKRVILEEIAEWTQDSGDPHPAAIRAKAVLEARKATKEVELYDKLIQAGRFHASFIVIGTKSSRMSGTDGLNPQGINHSKKVRAMFPLAWDDLELWGGDFSSFEVSLAAAVYKDPLLDEDLLKGKKMAGLFGETFYPDMKYDSILESEGSEEDYYDKSKRGMYAFFYGGNEKTLEDRIGISADIGAQAIEMLQQRYKGIARARKRIENMFCSMRQPGGIGSKVIWSEPADYIESPLGFRRYFTLENRICKALFDLSHDPPDFWKNIKIKVMRRDRIQTVQGATQSALYGAAFQIQAANLRASANHEIQCFGSQITKAVQCVTWGFQPYGINKWYVMPFNVHDEIDAPCLPGTGEKIKEAVLAKIETYRGMVPLIKMKWDKLATWKGKS